MAKLKTLGLAGGKLTTLNLPAGLSSLAVLNLNNNQLTNLTLPPDMQQLTGIFLDGNPLVTFVLSEPMAAGNLAAIVATLRDQGVNVFDYPLALQLVRPQQLTGAFHFGITGPPGVYTILQSTNLTSWSVLGAATNTLGSNSFFDLTAPLSSQKFFRARANPDTLP